jgi:hypothetical protein
LKQLCYEGVVNEIRLVLAAVIDIRLVFLHNLMDPAEKMRNVLRCLRLLECGKRALEYVKIAPEYIKRALEYVERSM